ncbi:MAG: hypothetical protein A2Y53_02090 [Chloroflexi bacterium RBG_16_47_49]|nr:MAG: hypothetical protein A2Y53_02090 [Chloroflexi bacterium RBG_16_47_49]
MDLLINFEPGLGDHECEFENCYQTRQGFVIQYDPDDPGNPRPITKAELMSNPPTFMEESTFTMPADMRVKLSFGLVG